MRVLVTGHQGYIGPHVVEILRQQDHFVVGVDLDLYAASEIYQPAQPHESLKRDVLELDREHLRGFDAVVHLAAISNDAMGLLDPALTWKVNYEATLQLASRAKQAGVRRFLFSSSCSVYGHSGDLPADETAPTQPLSVYAETKVRAEEGLAALADDSFSPTYLRNATAFGLAPRFRTDLVLNNLLASAWSDGEIRLLSDGNSWRPLVHCRDIARAFAHLLVQPTERVHNEAFNIGARGETFTVRQVAEAVQDVMPHASISHAAGAAADPRNYRVDFSKVERICPDFRLQSNLGRGTRELSRYLAGDSVARATLRDDRFVRLKVLRAKLARGEVPFHFVSPDAALELAG